MNPFSTATLAGVVDTIKPVPTFAKNMFFRDTITSDREEIWFDVHTDKPRLTPFVHPMSEAGIVESIGFASKSAKPAYLKDKRPFSPNDGMTRSFGEQLMGNLSADQRIVKKVQEATADMSRMFDRRIEVMCMEALLNAQQTIKGKGYNAVVDFGRTGGNAYAPTVAWDHTNANAEYDADIAGDFEAAALTISKAGGGMVKAVIMDTIAWGYFKLNRAIVGSGTGGRIGFVAASTTQKSKFLEPMMLEEGEAQYMGNYGTYEIWVYNYAYLDPYDNTEKKIMPDKTVLFVGSNVQATQHYGAIRDLKAMNGSGMATAQKFLKSWEEEDPSVRYLMLQSAPLMVPWRPDATIKLTVAS